MSGRFPLPAGLAAARSRALTRLVAEITGTAPDEAPLPLAPALMFADPAVQAALRMPEPAAGQVLVHDYQGLDLAGPFPLDTALDAAAEAKAGAGSTEYRVRLFAGGAAVAELRTGLRQLPGRELAGAKGLRLRGGAETPDWQAEATVSAAEIAQYCAISGDANPLHLDAGHVARVGLSAPPVPGMLLLSLFQPGCAALAPGLAVTGLKARFMAPVYRGRRFRLTLTRRGSDPAGGQRARGFLLLEDGTAALIVDLVFGGKAAL